MLEAGGGHDGGEEPLEEFALRRLARRAPMILYMSDPFLNKGVFAVGDAFGWH